MPTETGSKMKFINNLYAQSIVLLIVMTSLFVLVVGKVYLDRNQETLYLGEPYYTINSGNIFLNHRDPFEENGWHSVFVPALILKVTGSLAPLRAYQFSFSLAAIVLMFLLCCRYLKTDYLSRSGPKWLVALLCLSVWVSIPLIFQYPIQCNGMFLGLVFVLSAFLVYEKRPVLALFLFGCAAASKGQFLTYFPGILIYQFLIKRQGVPLPRRILAALGDALILCSAHFILAFAGMLFGWFRTSQDFIHYFFMQITLMTSFTGKALAQPGQSHGIMSFFGSLLERYEKYEFKTYGFLAWSHILFSASACLYFIGRAIYGLFKKDNLRPVEGLMGFAMLPFWVNFLFVWGYPYWYNVLCVMTFNVYFAVRLLDGFESLAERRMTIPIRRAFNIALVCVLIASIAHSLRSLQPFNRARHGDVFEPYPWMKQ